MIPHSFTPPPPPPLRISYSTPHLDRNCIRDPDCVNRRVLRRDAQRAYAYHRADAHAYPNSRADAHAHTYPNSRADAHAHAYPRAYRLSYAHSDTRNPSGDGAARPRAGFVRGLHALCPRRGLLDRPRGATRSYVAARP